MINCRSIAPVLLLVTLIPYTTAEFAEYPMNITLVIGTSEAKAVFRCRHQSLMATIGWRVNGSAPREFSDVTTGSIRENNSLVDTLTIQPVRSEYNGTEVICRALFFDGSPAETTPPATLTIIAGKSPVTTESVRTTMETMKTQTTTIAPTTTTTGITSTDAATTVMTSESPTTVTLAERVTTEPRPTSSVTNFIQVPSPPLLIVSLEERYTYMCNNSMTNRIYWQVNNSRLNFDIFPVEIDTTTIRLPDGHRLYTLTIGGIPEHNETTIQCVAEFEDKSVEETPVVTFVMQGLLLSVSNITRNDNTIAWKAPFSLNLTNADPDIVYCVEVYNITCGRSLLISECDVMETSYTNDALLPGYIYEYTVTPRSNVEGASNGTSQNASEIFMWLKLSKRRNRISMINGSTSNSQVSVQLHLDPHKVSEPVMQVTPPSDSVHILLDPLENLDENETLVMPMVVRGINVYKVTLPYQRLWNYTLLAYSCKEHPITEPTVLSTHDAQNVSITTTGNPGQIRVTADIIFGSTAIGLLVIVYSLTDYLDIYYHFAKVDQSRVDDHIMGLTGGLYQVLVYVVEENKLPFQRSAITPKSISISGNRDTQLTSPLNYHVNSTPTGVCIICTLMDSSSTDCVAVVHQRISNLTSSDLINIRSARLNQSGENTAYGCIEGLSLTDYQVGVIGVILTQKMRDDMDGPTQACYVVGLSCIIAVMVLVIILSCVTYKVKKVKHASGEQQKGDYSDNVNIEMVKCGAYEVVQLSRQRVTMNDNPAYGEIGVGEYTVIVA